MARESAIEKREAELAQPEQMRSGRTYIPNVDIVERDDELLLLADMPGVKAEDVDIHYERGLLAIHGEVMPRQDPATTSYVLREYGVGDFHRRFEIGEGIDAAGIEAELRDGVLRVHLPKVKDIRPRKIAVKA